MSGIRKLVAEEFGEPVEKRVREMARAIAARHGAAARSVIFYGSCLREQQLEGLMLHHAKPAWSDGSVREDTAWKPVFITEDVPAARERLEKAGTRVRALHQYDDRLGFDAIDPDGNVFRIANK